MDRALPAALLIERFGPDARLMDGDDMTDDPTGPDLGALAALERAATPAPWDEPHMVQPNMAGRHQWWIKAPGPAGLHATGRDEDVHLVVAMRNALPALLERLAQYEGAITWGTSCLSCANVLDGAHGETVRAEQAEKERDLLGRQQQALLDLCDRRERSGHRSVPVSDIHLTVITDPADASPAATPQAEPATPKDDSNRFVLCPDLDCTYDSYTLAEMDDHIRTKHAEPAAPHCGLCGSEACPGTPGKGCMPGPFETYEPGTAPAAADRGEPA